MSNQLIEITQKAMSHFENKTVVLPSEYSHYFGLHAGEIGLKLEEVDVALKHIKSHQDKLESIFHQTSENLSTLSESAKSAAIAILNKDDQELHKIKNKITFMEEKINFLQKELFSDTLTKAYNRKWLSDVFLNKDCFTSTGHIIFMDLNDFKYINDTYGHIVGDMVLRYFADFLKREYTFNDVKVVRYAGDEFIVILDFDDLTLHIEKTTHDIQTKLSHQKLKPKNSNQNGFSFSFSYGITKYQNGDNFQKTIELVDEKMYENKKHKK